MISITSAQNSIIKQVAKLSTSVKARKDLGLIVLDGIHLCEEWEKNYEYFEYLFVTEKFKQHSEFQKFKHQEDIIEIPEGLMIKISPSDSPVGILGVAKKPKSSPLSGEEQTVVFLESISDPGNIGAILRTAGAFGVDAVVLDSHCVDVFSPKVLRAAMGAHFYLPIIEGVDLSSEIKDFPGVVYATVLKPEAGSLFDTKFPRSMGFLFGNEGAGVSADLQEACSEALFIPMNKKTESLNVSVAAGVCLAERWRQS